MTATKQQYNYGMIGLGTMGRNLVLNMGDHGYSVAGFDKDKTKVDALDQEAGDRQINGFPTLEEFMDALSQPRIIMLLVPAGPIVDAVIDELKPFLAENDLIMDWGNSHFTDTNERTERLAKENIHFMGVGVSGGESGARFGPSIMPGGLEEAYKRVAPVLEDISAKVNNEPCVTYLGKGSAGHYVKMVHNGIEYALMQLIAESYHLMKNVVGLNNQELHETFARWNAGELKSFLMEITADIFEQKDDLTDNPLIDMILGNARQKGTGKWTSQNAMDLQVPIPSIDTAVAMRDLSALRTEREAAKKMLEGPKETSKVDKEALIQSLEDAMFFSMITTYAQGMSLLLYANKEYKYGYQLDDVAKIWRGGCIIRAALLEDIRSVFHQDSSVTNLIVSDIFAEKLIKSQASVRIVIQQAVEAGIPIPALMSSLAYYDGFRSGWLPANLTQAQRDYFGAHTYERIDRAGTFHTHWK